MEGSPTGMEKRSRQPHLVECLQKKEVKGAASIHQHSVELDVLYDRPDNQRIPPSFGIKSGWSPQLKVMGTLDHLRYSGVAGPTAKTSRAVSFFFLLGSYESGPPNS
jgi:hypothetical protein